MQTFAQGQAGRVAAARQQQTAANSRPAEVFFLRMAFRRRGWFKHHVPYTRGAGFNETFLLAQRASLARL